MASPFLSEIRIMSFNFAPKGWALCDGQLLPINQNQALFSLLGTTYGGNGQTNFGLPDLQGRVPLHRSQTYPQGTKAGVEQVTIDQSTMPMHNHTLLGTTTAGDKKLPASVLGTSTAATDYFYSPPTNQLPLNSATIGPAGQGQAHNNVQPFLVLNFSIALQGIFPSRN